MHQALRDRAMEDVRVLGSAIAALETGGQTRGPGWERGLDELRQLRKSKEDSLEARHGKTETPAPI